MHFRRVFSFLLVFVFSFTTLLPPALAQNLETQQASQEVAANDDQAAKEKNKEPGAAGNGNGNQSSKDQENSGNPQNSKNNQSNQSSQSSPQTSVSDEDTVCLWVDDLGRPREEWHKDMVGGKPINLFKQCFPKTDEYFQSLPKIADQQKGTGNQSSDSQNNQQGNGNPGNGNQNNSNGSSKKLNEKLQQSADAKKNALKQTVYSPQHPHPGCEGIIKAYENQETNGKNPIGPGLTKNYQNCLQYGTPYPGNSPDPGTSDDEHQKYRVVAMGFERSQPSGATSL